MEPSVDLTKVVQVNFHIDQDALVKSKKGQTSCIVLYVLEDILFVSSIFHHVAEVIVVVLIFLCLKLYIDFYNNRGARVEVCVLLH